MPEMFEAIERLPIREFAPGETLLEQGSADGQVYILDAGEVEVLKDGVEIVRVSEKGAVFGEMSVLLGTPPTATVKARNASKVFVVEDPGQFLRQHPDAALYVARILAQRLDSLNRYLVDVKMQFRDYEDHVGMVDQVLESLMSKHPRRIPRRDPGEND